MNPTDNTRFASPSRRTLALCTALRAALVATHHPAAQQLLEPLPDKGLAHDHVRLVGTGLLARMPKQSQMGLDAAHNLAYQSVCFARAAVGGRTPALHGWLAPSVHLPRGALLVEEVVGHPAQLPQDLSAIARSLAALHALALPSPVACAPLLHAHDPLQALCDDIEAQASHLPAAQVEPVVSQAVARQLQQLKALCAAAPRPPRSLIAFDAHPGNFIVRADGRAMLVDLEKCRYSYPGLDLAHATLYTSTTWDVDTQAVLSVAEVTRFYRDWADATGSAAEAATAWHVPLRSAMALWSLTWCAKWRVLSQANAQPGSNGEDWSAQRSQVELVRHVRERVDHYLSPGVVVRLQQELHALDEALRP